MKGVAGASEGDKGINVGNIVEGDRQRGPEGMFGSRSKQELVYSTVVEARVTVVRRLKQYASIKIVITVKQMTLVQMSAGLYGVIESRPQIWEISAHRTCDFWAELPFGKAFFCLKAD